ncbi:unnamed protein product [Cunninghamella echinulata]
MKELYEEEICKCITQLKKDDNTITMKAILDDLKDLIVNSSSNTDEIIRDWTYRIKKCAKKLNTKIKNNNIKYWDNILSPQLSVNTISSHILSNYQLPLTSSTIHLHLAYLPLLTHHQILSHHLQHHQAVKKIIS